MAQAGTDSVLHINVGDVVVVPYAAVVVAAAGAVGTEGTTATTLDVDKNGAASGVAVSVGASTQASGVTSGSYDAPLATLAAGDVLTVVATYGTGAAGGSVTLNVQRTANVP